MSRQKSERNASQTPNTPPLPWEAILDKHGPSLRYVIGQSVTDQTDAEEVLAEVYLGLARAVCDSTPIQSADHARNLLFLMARQRVVDYFRRRGAARPVSLGDGDAEIVDASTLEENDRWQQYNAEDVQKALTKLPPEQRQILFLKYYETGKETGKGVRPRINIGTGKGVRPRINIESGRIFAVAR